MGPCICRPANGSICILPSRSRENLKPSGWSFSHRADMESNVTLYWFVLPKWFMDMGGFEKEENIEEFVNWGRKAFEFFGAPSLLGARP